MKTRITHRNRAFTLIEMVGVLAVIAILASLLIPKIFAAINEARLNNAIESYNSIKSASMSYFGKYGRFGGVGGASITTSLQGTNWDAKVLLPEGLIEKPFMTKVGDTNFVVVVPAPSNTNAVTTAAYDGAYDLSRDGLANETSDGSLVVEAVFTGVSSGDAYELSRRLDGDGLAVMADKKNFKGRVKYDCSSGPSAVHIYIAHK